MCVHLRFQKISGDKSPDPINGHGMKKLFVLALCGRQIPHHYFLPLHEDHGNEGGPFWFCKWHGP